MILACRAVPNINKTSHIMQILQYVYRLIGLAGGIFAFLYAQPDSLIQPDLRLMFAFPDTYIQQHRFGEVGLNGFKQEEILHPGYSMYYAEGDHLPIAKLYSDKEMIRAVEIVEKYATKIPLFNANTQLDVVFAWDKDGVKTAENTSLSLITISGKSGMHYIMPTADNQLLKGESDRLHAWVILGYQAIKKVFAHNKEPKWQEYELMKMLVQLSVAAQARNVEGYSYSLNQRTASYLQPYHQDFSEQLWDDPAWALCMGAGYFYGQLANILDDVAHIEEEKYQADLTDLIIARERSYKYFIGSETELSYDKYDEFKMMPDTIWNGQKGWLAAREGLTGNYILHSETNIAAYYTYIFAYAYHNDTQYRSWYMKHFLDAVTKIALDDHLKRSLPYIALYISWQLEHYKGTPQGINLEKTGIKIMNPMFPIALLDVMTHFEWSDEEWRHNFFIVMPEVQPTAFETYTRAHRKSLKQEVKEYLDETDLSWKKLDQAVYMLAEIFLRLRAVII